MNCEVVYAKHGQWKLILLTSRENMSNPTHFPPEKQLLAYCTKQEGLPTSLDALGKQGIFFSFSVGGKKKSRSYSSVLCGFIASVEGLLQEKGDLSPSFSLALRPEWWLVVWDSWQRGLAYTLTVF